MCLPGEISSVEKGGTRLGGEKSHGFHSDHALMHHDGPGGRNRRRPGGQRKRYAEENPGGKAAKGAESPGGFPLGRKTLNAETTAVNLEHWKNAEVISKQKRADRLVLSAAKEKELAGSGKLFFPR